MRLLKHENNSKWWSKKTGEANAEQVTEFAREYKKEDVGAWAVTITEGEGWIGAGHVRDVMAATRADGAVAVWISDGRFGQVVWRKEVTK